MIKKVVIPVGGFGTRFLPITKSVPKEMLPLVDKPLIQYAVEEAVAAGIKDVILITGRNKTAIEDHFDKAYELEMELLNRGRLELLEYVRDVVPRANYIYIRQSEALGLGHAILCAANLLNEPFAVILADDVIRARKPVLCQMMEVFDVLCNRFGSNISLIAIERVNPEDTSNYGIVEVEETGDDLVSILSGIEEKPVDARSDLAVIGRYILSPSIFGKLSGLKCGYGGEFQLSDGISELLKEEKVFTFRYDGERFDCGSKMGYIKANFVFACDDEMIRDELIDFVATLKNRYET